MDAMDCGKESIRRTWADPQRAPVATWIFFEKKNRIQFLPLFIALIGQLPRRQFRDFSNDSVVDTISRSICRNLCKDLRFPFEPRIAIVLNALGNEKINNKECQCCSGGEGKGSPNRNSPSCGCLQNFKHV